MKNIVFILLLLLIAQMVIAQEQQQKKDEFLSSSELSLQASTMPGLKLGFTERFYFPFLQGEGALTKDNNIGIALTGEISPVSLNGLVEAVWTPIAFFQLTAGGRIGSGWIIELPNKNEPSGKKKSYGIGINRPDAAGNTEHTGKAFDGLLWKAQAGAVLQADLAAVIPGDWNHVVARTYHEINYRGYTAASKYESWSYEDDNGYFGENCNGFNYYSNFLLGYQMPIFLNMAALLAEADLYLYDTPDRSKWGDDLIRWTFGLILNFSISKKIDIAVLTQFWTRRNFLEPDWQNLYYRKRTLDTSNPIHLEFFRVAAALTLRL
jgi:hypothetical protein